MTFKWKFSYDKEQPHIHRLRYAIMWLKSTETNSCRNVWILIKSIGMANNFIWMWKLVFKFCFVCVFVCVPFQAFVKICSSISAKSFYVSLKRSRRLDSKANVEKPYFIATIEESIVRWEFHWHPDGITFGIFSHNKQNTISFQKQKCCQSQGEIANIRVRIFSFTMWIFVSSLVVG